MEHKKLRKRILGSIQGKLFILALITVILLSTTFILAFVNQGNQFVRMNEVSGEKEQTAVAEVSGKIMGQEVTSNLDRSNRLEADFANDLFADARMRMTFMAECATKLFADPDAWAPAPYAGPDPADDGKWTTKVIYAAGTDKTDGKVTSKLGLVANLSDTMFYLCQSFGVSDVYIGLPEGAFFSASQHSSNWFTDGSLRQYDPRERIWYQDAVQAGHLIFTNGEWDANTGEYCIECAVPVYDPAGNLQAVIGQDLYLNSILEVLDRSTLDGEYNLLVNQAGRALLPMQAENFPIAPEEREADLRSSRYELIARTVQSALQGEYTEVAEGSLHGGNYYLIATPIPTTGWVLVSAYDKAVSDQSTALLQGSISTVQQDAREELESEIGKTRTVTIAVLVAIALLTLGGTLALSRRIVKPLNIISERVSALGEDNLEFRMEDDYRTGDEVEQLAESFAAMSRRTLDYMDKTVRMTAEKQRIGTELALANQIQATMLPHIFPSFPEREEFSIYASMDPAKEVGGDFYDFFLVDDNHLCLVMADVSGKGVPAAMFMMSSKTIIANNAMAGKSPARVLTDTNTALCASGQEDMFVTVWIGVLEISTGKLTAANGGHEYPALTLDGRFELYQDEHGLLVGGIPDLTYDDYELQLRPGDKLFVYTDGVPEAKNGAGKMFGLERMTDTLNAHKEASPEELLHSVRGAVDSFVEGAEQFDDLTMLCLEYKGKK